MKRLALIGIAVLVAAVFLLLPLMNTKSNIERPKYTVGVVLKAMDSEHWLAVRAGLDEMARAKNIRLVVLTPENESAYEEQNRLIDDLLADGIDALVVSPTNINHTGEWIKKAREKNVPLLTIDEKIDGIPYVGSDNYSIGKMAGEELAKALPSGSEVAIISGSSTQDAHIKRVNGFSDYLASNTNLKIVAEVTADTKYRLATVEGDKLLHEFPNLQGMFVTSAFMTLGALDASEHAGKKIAVVGVDTQNDTLAALKEGRLAAMISQDGKDIGHRAINAILKELQGENIQDSYAVNEVITKENALQYQNKEE